jgi:molecular chaperone DnaK (HSP70)
MLLGLDVGTTNSKVGFIISSEIALLLLYVPED